jgi:hypothetical protein
VVHRRYSKRGGIQRDGCGRFRRDNLDGLDVASDSHACRTPVRDGEQHVASGPLPAVGANEDAALPPLLDAGRAQRAVASKNALDGDTRRAFAINRS